MKVLGQYGGYKVVEQQRQKFGGPAGLNPVWIEYQVRFGRRVVARHELFGSAMRDAQGRNKADWDAIGEQLRKGA